MIKKILSTHYYWIAISAILIIGRISLLCSLYFFKNPFGGPVVENVNKFLWHSIYVESGVVMALVTCFILASFWKDWTARSFVQEVEEIIYGRKASFQYRK